MGNFTHILKPSSSGRTNIIVRFTSKLPNAYIRRDSCQENYVSVERLGTWDKLRSYLFASEWSTEVSIMMDGTCPVAEPGLEPCLETFDLPSLSWISVPPDFGGIPSSRFCIGAPLLRRDCKRLFCSILSSCCFFDILFSSRDIRIESGTSGSTCGQYDKIYNQQHIISNKQCNEFFIATYSPISSQ